MTEQVTCPANGCDYTGVLQSVKAHYSGKRDNAHTGGYERAGMLLDTDSSSETETEPDILAFPEKEDTSTADETATEPETEPETCERCGSHSIQETSVMLETANHLENRHEQLLADSDYVCADCGAIFDV